MDHNSDYASSLPFLVEHLRRGGRSGSRTSQLWSGDRRLCITDAIYACTRSATNDRTA